MKKLSIAILVLWFALVQSQVAAACQPLPVRVWVPIAQEGDMGNYFIIQPQATTNLVINPSPALATTGYSAMAGAIARSASKQRRSAYSIAVTPTSSANDGAYYGTIPTVSGTTYTFALDFWGADGVPYQIYFASTAAALQGVAATLTGTGAWQRVSVTFTETSSATRRLYFTKDNSASVDVFYVDGLQAEALSYATTYCDGMVKDCYWSAGKYTSTSTRASNVRSGGRKIDLTSLSAHLVSQSGTGMPIISNQTTPYASLGGSFLNRQSVQQRSFTISLSTSGDGTAEWHANRQALIDLVKPDLVYPTQPFVLAYDGGGRELRIPCYYDGGLEMADGTRDIETVGVKCLSVDPYWHVDGGGGASLNVQQSVSNANGILQQSAGLWSAMGTGASIGALDYAVQALALGLDGTLYAGGAFSLMGGVSNTRNIAKWDGSAWTAMGTGASASSEVRALAVGPDGTIYAGGSFTSMGGVANTAYIAKWNGSAWSAMGTGANGNVYAITVGADGSVYAAGDFTLMGGVANTVRIAKWNGSAWSALSTGINGLVYNIVFGPDNSLYASGSFTLAGGIANTVGVAKWSGSAWSALSTGLASGAVVSMVFGLDGYLYIGGSFTSVGGVSATNIARWSGTSWYTVGRASPFGSAYPSRMYVMNDGTIAMGGNMTSAMDITVTDGFVRWNGSVYLNMDVSFPAAPVSKVVWSILQTKNDTLYVGFSNAGTAVTSALTSVTNDGSSLSYPRITIKGPSTGTSRIYHLKNLTTGQAIYLNYTINAGETAVLDLTPGRISFTSDFQGNILGKILPGSKTSAFSLLPGVNSISFYAAGSTVTATTTWPENCWSVDSSGS